MNPVLLPFRRRFAVLLLVTGLLGAPGVSRAGNGLRLLEAELPARVGLLNADCNQLAAAVGRATLVHPPDAPAILRVALTRGTGKPARGDGRLPCAFALRIFSVSVAAAPTQASALLDLATELYPACAAELAAVMRDYDQVSYDYKDRVLDDKTVVDDKNGPARNAAASADPAGSRPLGTDPAGTFPDPHDLSERDINGLGYGDAYGFGSGFGPGFPGSPGFTGSPPDGGRALPPAPVTAAVNG